MADARFAAEAKRNPTKVDEWQRQRRTAYSSGRREEIGFEKPELPGPKRKMKKSSPISTRMPFKGRYRWRVY